MENETKEIKKKEKSHLDTVIAAIGGVTGGEQAMSEDDPMKNVFAAIGSVGDLPKKKKTEEKE